MLKMLLTYKHSNGGAGNFGLNREEAAGVAQ